MKNDKNHHWWNMKPFGYLPPKEENNIIFFVLAGIILLTFLYIAKYYF